MNNVYILLLVIMYTEGERRLLLPIELWGFYFKLQSSEYGNVYIFSKYINFSKWNFLGKFVYFWKFLEFNKNYIL